MSNSIIQTPILPGINTAQEGTLETVPATGFNYPTPGPVELPEQPAYVPRVPQLKLPEVKAPQVPDLPALKINQPQQVAPAQPAPAVTPEKETVDLRQIMNDTFQIEPPKPEVGQFERQTRNFLAGLVDQMTNLQFAGVGLQKSLGNADSQRSLRESAEASDKVAASIAPEPVDFDTRPLQVIADQVVRSSPSILTSAAGAYAGAKAGGAVGALFGPAAPVAAPVGAAVGGFLGWMGTTFLTQRAGSNVQRQYQEGGTDDTISPGAAFSAAVGQSALDALFGKVVGWMPGAVKAYGRTVLTTNATGIVTETAKLTGKLAGAGVVGAATEVGEQVLERYQAQQSVKPDLAISPTDKGARQEYIIAGAAGAVMGVGARGVALGIDKYRAGKDDKPSTKPGEFEDTGEKVTQGNGLKQLEGPKIAGLLPPPENGSQWATRAIAEIVKADQLKRDTDPTYSGDPSIPTVIQLLRMIEQAPAKIAAINAMPVEARNTEQNQTRLAAAQEALALGEVLRDPQELFQTDLWVLRLAGKTKLDAGAVRIVADEKGPVFKQAGERLAVDEEGRPILKNKSAKVFATFVGQDGKTYDAQLPANAEVVNVRLPAYRNKLANPAVREQLARMADRARAEAQAAADNASTAGQARGEAMQAQAATEQTLGKETSQPALPAPATDTKLLPAPQGRTYGDGFVMFDDSTPGMPGAQSPFQTDPDGQRTMGFPTVSVTPKAAPTAPSAPAGTADSGQLSLPGVPKTRAQAEAAATMAAARSTLQQRSVLDFSELPPELQARVQQANVRAGAKEVAPKTITREQLAEIGLPPQSIEALFRRAAENDLLSQSKNAAQRGGLRAQMARGVDGIMSFFSKLPLPDRLAMRRLLRAMERSLGTSLTELEVVDFAAYLARDPKIDGTDAAAAFLSEWLTLTSNGLAKGAIALRNFDPNDPLSRTALRNVAHELVHFALRVRLGPRVTARMEALYNHLEASMPNDPEWMRIKSMPTDKRGGYGDMSPAVQAEEFLVAKAEAALAGEFGDTKGARSLPTFVIDLLRELVKYAREVFAPLTGSDILTNVFRNIEVELGLGAPTPRQPINDAAPGTQEMYRRISKRELEAEDIAAIERVTKANSPAREYVTLKLKAFREEFSAKAGWAQPKLDKIEIEGDPSLSDNIKLVFKEVPWGFAGDLKTNRVGTPAYTRAVKKVAKVISKELKDVAARAAQGDAVAKAIMAQRVWYSEFRRQAIELLGDRFDLFADVLGATSPQMNVRVNFAMALDALTQFSRGAFDEALQAYASYIEANGENASDKNYTGPRIAMSNGAQYGVNTMNLMRALLGYGRSTRTITGNARAPKVVNFIGNVAGTAPRATIDLWAARILQRAAKLPRIPFAASGGVKGKFSLKDDKTTGQFGFGQDVFDIVAAENSMTPDEAQAVAWFIEKQLWETNGWTNVEGGSYVDELFAADLSFVTAGVTIQDAPGDWAALTDATRLNVDPAAGSNTFPTTARMMEEIAPVRRLLTGADSVVSATVAPTLGLYGNQFERSYALTATVRQSFEIGSFVKEVFGLAQRAGQTDAFVSIAVPAPRVDQHPNARPGLTIRLKAPVTPFELLPIVRQLQAHGVDGFTVLPDPTNPGLARGLTAQAVPEMTVRWDDALREQFTKNPASINDWLVDRALALEAVGSYIQQNHDGVASATLGFYDTLVSGKESYDRDTEATGTSQPLSRIGGEFGAWGQSAREAVARRIADLTGGDGPDARGAGVDSADDIPFFRRDGEGNGAGRPQPTGDGSGRDQGRRLAPLEGAPSVPGFHGPIERIVAVAEGYARELGIPLARQATYVEINPERAARIAEAYDAMPHDPTNPTVREAYENLIAQTTAQYQALVDAGFKFWFADPSTLEGTRYLSTPWNALRDLKANQSMGVFPTNVGFGSNDSFDPAQNPLLAETPFEWPVGGPEGTQLQRVLANDLFRAVHDAFGHGMEGAGFRARGEENAWQAHSRLFTGSALAALTSETRGQNSWLNFGPHGEQNRNAPVDETIFADQKTGLMPEWTWTEGLAGDMSTDPEVLAVGECFPWAAKQQMMRTDDHQKLVHATVSPDGKAYPHAWVERDGKVFDWQTMVAGLSRYAGIGWPRDEFYRVFRPTQVTVYTGSIGAQMRKFGHAGPWADGGALYRRVSPKIDELLSDKHPSVRSNPQSSSEFVPDPAQKRAAKAAGFDTDRIWYFGSPTGEQLVRDGKFDPTKFDRDGVFGPAAYLSSFWGEARGYAQNAAQLTGGAKPVDPASYGPRTMAAYVRLEPKEILNAGAVYSPREARQRFGVTVQSSVTGREVYANLQARFKGDNAKVNAHLRQLGIRGIEHVMRNQFGGPGFVPGANVYNLAVIDTARVRLVDAAFDKSKLDNDGLLLRRERGASWTRERFDQEMQISSYSMSPLRSTSSVAFVDPSDFVAATTTTSPDGVTAQMIADENSPLNEGRLKSETQSPFLVVQTDPKTGETKIVGHEGRHRMDALARAGVKKVAVVLRYREGTERLPVASLKLVGQWKELGSKDITVSNVQPLSLDNEENAWNAVNEFEGGNDIRFRRDDRANDDALFNRAAQTAKSAGPMAGPGPLPKWMYRVFQNEFFDFVFGVSSYGSIVANSRNTLAGRMLANIVARSRYGIGGNGAPIRDAGYHDAVDAGMTKLNTPLVRALNQLSNKKLQNLAKVLRGGYGLVDGKVRVPSASGLSSVDAKALGEVQQVLSDAYDYLKAALIAGGKAAVEIPPKLKAYFPQHWVLEGTFAKNHEKGRLRGEDRVAVVTAFLKGRGVYANGGEIDGRRVSQDRMLQQLIDRMLGLDGRVSYGFDLHDALDNSVSIKTRQELERILAFPGDASVYLIKDGSQWRPARTQTSSTGTLQVEKGSVKVELSDLLNNDVVGVLQDHIRTTVRRAEFARRMGDKGQKFAEYLDKIDKELTGRGETPLTTSEQMKLKSALKANFGMLGSMFKVEHSDLYKTMSVVRMIGDFAYLTMAAVSSLPETAMPLVRMGIGPQAAALSQQMRDLLRTPKTILKSTGAAMGADSGDRWRAFKSHYGMDSSEMRAFSEDVVGTVLPSIHHALMDEVNDNSLNWVEKVRSRFFSANLLEPLTKWQRTGATAAAVTYIGSLKTRYERGGFFQKRAERALTEIGLTYDDIKAFDKRDYRSTTNPQINAALRQIVNETVLAPNAAAKPTYFSDPRFMLFAHIRSYQTAFSNHVLQRVGREAVHFNFGPLLGLAVVTGLATALYELREWIRYGDEGNPYYNRLGLDKNAEARLVLVALDRGGLWGPMQMFANMALGTKIGKDPSIGPAFSPTVGMMESYLKATFTLLTANDAADLRKAADTLSRQVPVLNMMGQTRQDLVTAVTGIQPRSGGGGGGGGLTMPAMSGGLSMQGLSMR